MKRVFSKKIVWFMLGLLVGGLLVFGWQLHLQKVMKERNDFSYSVVSSTLQAKNITWKKYPQFRTVEFALDGELVVTMPHDAELSPEGLSDAGTLTEKKRETKKLGYGAEQVIFDEVTYQFEDAEVKANMPKPYGNPEKDATYGYELSYVDEEQEIVFAFILPMCEEFQVCTKEQTEYWKYSQSLELGLLSLSKTYKDKDITSTKRIQEGVTLTKCIGDTFDCLITNTGETEWQYSMYLPSIEVWNQGVWMELSSYLDDSLMARNLMPGESADIIFTERCRSTFPYFSPGLYRVVVYGGDDTCIITEDFVLSGCQCKP